MSQTAKNSGRYDESPSNGNSNNDSEIYDDGYLDAADDDGDDEYFDEDGHYVDEDGYYYEDEETEALQGVDPEIERRRRMNRLNPDYEQEFRDDDDDDGSPARRDLWGRKRAKCCDHCSRCCRNCIRGFFLPPICDFRRWCGCPHGACYTVMGFILALSGLIMMAMLLLNCDVQRITIKDANGQVPDNEPQIGYGFISRQPITGEIPQVMGCVLYPDDEKRELFDAWFQVGRFMIFISALLGVVGICVLSASFCVAWSANTFQHWLLWNYVFAACCVGLSFMIFGSDYCQENECKLGKGGVSVISVFFFWLTAANSVKSMPEAMPDEGEDDEDLYYESRDDMYRDDVQGQPGPLVSPYYGGEYDDGYQYDDDGNPYFYEEDGTPVYVDSEGNAIYYLDEDGQKVYYDDDNDDDEQGGDGDDANKEEEEDLSSVDLLNDPQITPEERQHGYTVPPHQVNQNLGEATFGDDQSMPQTRLPRVGDEDGPSIT